MPQDESLTPREELNRFQTFAFGPYVPTVMDAHFDPYREGPLRPGLTKWAMENVERVAVPAPGRR